MTLVSCLFSSLLTQLIKSFSNNVSTAEETDVVLEDAANSTNKAVLFTVEDLSREFPLMDWKKSISQFEQHSKVPITRIYVQNPEYMRQLSVLVAKTSPQTIDNFMCWSFMARFLPYAPPALRKIYEDFRKEVPEPSGDDEQSEPSRVFLSHWQECVHLTCEGLKIPAALTYLQTRGEHLEHQKTVVRNMIANIKSAFHHIIDKQTWLPNQQTKDLLKQRVDMIKNRIGFPDFVFDRKSMDQEYESLRVDPEQVFLANVMEITLHEVRMDLKKLNESVDPEKEWLMQPLVSNAYFDSSSDNISES